MTPGGHNSSFSPEDLCSNLLGTVVANRAVRRGGLFNDAVTTELAALLGALGAQSVAETRNAFDLVNGRWTNFANVSSLLRNDYLRRRNFTFQPWHAGHSSDSPVPAWVIAAPIDVSQFCVYEHTAGRIIHSSSFESELARVKIDAKARYGANFAFP
jgi:hypothetical protein